MYKYLTLPYLSCKQTGEAWLSALGRPPITVFRPVPLTAFYILMKWGWWMSHYPVQKNDGLAMKWKAMKSQSDSLTDTKRKHPIAITASCHPEEPETTTYNLPIQCVREAWLVALRRPPIYIQCTGLYASRYLRHDRGWWVVLPSLHCETTRVMEL